MDDSSTLIDRMISGLLPGFLIIGALVALVGEFHLPFWLALVLIAGTVASTIAYVLRIHGWELSFPLAHWKDLRWVVVPAVVAYTSWLDPTWSTLADVGSSRSPSNCQSIPWTVGLGAVPPGHRPSPSVRR